MKTFIKNVRHLLALSLLLLAVQPAVAFYDPSTQRWLNRDPIEEDGGVSAYAFVAGDPIAHYDHLGLFAAIGGSLGSVDTSPWAVVGIPIPAAKPKGRSCNEICNEALTNPQVPIMGLDGRPSIGGVVCDSDGKKCPCVFQFFIPGTAADIYSPGTCPALDDIIKEHESEVPPKRWTRGGEPEKEKAPCPRTKNRNDSATIWSSRSKPCNC